MKKTAYLGFTLAAVLMMTGSAAYAAECSGAWRVLPNYRGGGGPCAAIGLDTHRAVCQPGQRFATYCDDASGGRYRVCQSNIPCGGYRDRGGYRDDYDHPQDNHWWDNGRDRRDWGYRDRYRDYPPPPPPPPPPPRHGFDCTRWDYQHNRPCPPGTINRDCRNDCGGGM